MDIVFKRCIPENVGISSKRVINFAKRLEDAELPVHSLTIMRHDSICFDCAYAPIEKDGLHRMFSVTKSLVGIAIGFLIDEGKLSLDDHIVDFFPEKLPEGGAHPYLKMLTIRQMLSMQTCFNRNAYKVNKTEDWIGAFFTVEPDHIPGTSFAYDTASTHVLGYLVKKLSGMEFLDYLRVKFLDDIGFSKDAYMLTDPSGIANCGAGLVARTSDILKVLYVLAHEGKYNGVQLIPAEYATSAIEKHSDPSDATNTIEEMQGYGYQLWLTRHGGYVFFGMGGQLALYVPEKDIFLVTTADCQGRSGGVQLIYDAFWDEVYRYIDNEDDLCISDAINDAFSSKESDLSELLDVAEELEDFENSRKLYALSGDSSCGFAGMINLVHYDCFDNCCNIQDIVIIFDNVAEPTNGVLRFTKPDGVHELHFGLSYNIVQNFPIYNFKCAVSAAWKSDRKLLIKIQIIDSAVGNMFISLNYCDEYFTVIIKKIEESYFNDFNGIFSGKIRK